MARLLPIDKKIICISICFVLFCSCNVFGETRDERIRSINDKAANLISQHNFEEVYSILLEQYDLDEYDNDMLFVLGVSARNTGKNYEAIKYFTELLETIDSPRIRLELARTYFVLREADKAKEQFLMVRSLNPPEVVGKNIDKYIEAIESGIVKDWTIRTSVGYTYDNNVQTGTDQGSVLMYGFPFTLSDTAKKAYDHAYTYSIGWDYLASLTDTASWFSEIQFNVTDYLELNNLDIKTLNMSSGPIYRLKRNTLSIPVSVDYSNLGGEYDFGEYYTISHGISPQIKIPIFTKVTDKIFLTIASSYQHKQFRDNDDKNIDTITLSPSLRYNLGPSGFIEYSFAVEDGHATRSIWTNSAVTHNLAFFKTLIGNLSLYTSISYKDVWYELNEPAYFDKRNEDITTALLSLSYYFESIKSSVSCTYIYTDNECNIETYNYDRQQLAMKLSKNF